jgi:hypothetical protein
MLVLIGDIKIAALVDIGSDFDAIDQDLAEIQMSKGNSGFVCRHFKLPTAASGFSANIGQRTRSESDWMVSSQGASTFEGPRERKQVCISFSGFKDLRDPVIIGMPSVGRFGGIDVTNEQVWIAGLWAPRHLRSYGQLPDVCSQAIEVDAGGWYLARVLIDNNRLFDTLGSNHPCWVEVDPSVEDDLEVLEEPTQASSFAGLGESDLLARARAGGAVKLGGNSTIARARRTDEACHEAMELFRQSLLRRDCEGQTACVTRPSKVSKQKLRVRSSSMGWRTSPRRW